MSINPKDIIINSAYLDYKIIRDYSTWIDFYNACPLIQDLGESVKTYQKTYRIYEDSKGMLLSNGIFYDKINDILHTNSSIYKQQYTSLLLGYKAQRWISKDYYADKMTWFMVDDGDSDSFSIIRNNSILIRGLINNGDTTVYKTAEMINAIKNVVVVKNSDTYITQKVECIWPHEHWYSISKLNKFTAYDRTNLFIDFSNGMQNIASRLSMDVTFIANMAAGVLFSAYGADVNTVIPSFLNTLIPMTYIGFRIQNFIPRSGNTDDIFYHGWLGWEYLYDYKWNDYSNSLNLMNQWIHETYDTTVDLLKYILPWIRSVNGLALNIMDRHFGIARNDSILIDRTTWQMAAIININKTGDIVNITSIDSGSLSSTDVTWSTIKTTFFELFPDLSCASIETLFNSISDLRELVDTTSAWAPILILPSSIYDTQNSSSNLASIYLITLMMQKVIKSFINLSNWRDLSSMDHTFTPIYSFKSNVQTLNINSYINIVGNDRYTTYASKMLAINALQKIAPLQTYFFNPSIFDQLAGTSASIKTYASGSGYSRTNIDENVFDVAQPDCKIELNETISNGDLFLLAQAANDFEYNVFESTDVNSVLYMQSGPAYVYLAQRETAAFDDPNNIKIVFGHDSSALYGVLPDVEKSNIVSIPYKGLLLLSDITEGSNLELQNLWIQRDLTSSTWECKLRVVKNDSKNIDRLITFKFYGGTEKTVLQKLAYEFGLGFELVSSENPDDLELLRILYIVLNPNESKDNIVIEKVMQEASKLKLIFRKLLTSDIALRAVVADKDSQTILNQTDYVV